MSGLSIRQDAGVFSVEDGEQLIATVAAFLPNQLKSQFRQAAEDAEQRLEQFLVEKHQQLLDAIPKEIHYILQPLDDFDSAAIELAELGKRVSSKKNYSFQIGVSSNLSLAAGKVEDLAPPPTFELPDQHLLLGLSLEGSANLGATARGSRGILGASVTADADAGQSLVFFGSRPRHERLLHYLLQIPRQMANPTDLDELVACLDAGALLRFERLGMLGVQLGLDVEIAPAVKEFAGPLSVDTQLGGSLRVRYRDSSRCRLLLEKRGSDSYVLELQKTRKKTLTKSLQLGVDVQLVGFQNQLLEQVTRALPQDPGVKTLLTDLEDLAKRASGEKLATSLASRLEKDWSTGQAAIAFLVGDKAAESLAKELQSELGDRVLDALNSHVDPVNQPAADVAKRVSSLIARQLQLPMTHSDRLEQYLGDAVREAVSEFQNLLEGRLSDYIREKGEELRELLEPWEFLGDTVTEVTGSLGSNAQAAVSRVRTALKEIMARYTSLRQKILKVIREDFEEKIALTITAEKQRAEQTSTALRLEFTHATELIRSLYKDLWNGNLQQATSLLQALTQAPEKIRLSGEYVSLVQEMHKSTLAINFFGMAFVAEDLFNANTRVALNANGILVAAQGEGEVLERARFFGETQSVSANWRLDPLSDAGLSPPVILKVDVADASFEIRRETQDLFEPLETSALVRRGLGDEVESSLSQLGLKRIEDMRLSFSVVFRWEDWLRFVGTDTHGGTMSETISPEDFSDQYLLLLENTAEHFVEDARRLFTGNSRAEFKQVLLQVGKVRSTRDFRNLLGRSSGTLTTSQRNAWNTARYVHDVHNGLIGLRASWLNLVRAMPEEGVALDFAEMESVRRHITAVNNDLANLLDSSTRQTGLDQTRLTGFTAAGLKLLMMQTRSPNPFSSCIIHSAATGRLLFN